MNVRSCESMFAVPVIDTKKSRLQRSSGVNWSQAQKENAKQYAKFKNWKKKKELINGRNV